MGGVASGGGLTDLILRCWSIGKSKPFKEIISPFHRRLLLNLRLWNGVWLWRISGGSWWSIKAEMRLTTLCIDGGASALPPTPLYSSSGSSCISIMPVYKISSATWLTHNPVRSEMATRVSTTYIECYQIVLNIRADRHLYGNLKKSYVCV